MTLDELAAREDRLLAHIRGRAGSMEAKDAQLDRDGTYHAYRAVHDAYVALLRDPAARSEALKRALFLSWAAAVEPSCFTGLRDIDAEHTREILAHVEQDLAASRIDDELEWMLPWYHTIASYFFDTFDSPVLDAFIAETDPLLWQQKSAPREQFVGRGQLGVYWTSVRQLA